MRLILSLFCLAMLAFQSSAHAIINADLKLEEFPDVYATAKIQVHISGFLKGNTDLCSGVLIAPSIVLTAAHCIASLNSPEDIALTFSLPDGGSFRPKKITLLRKHIGFSDRPLNPFGVALDSLFDLGLIFFSDPLPKDLKPIPLSQQFPLPQSGAIEFKGMIAGFGTENLFEQATLRLGSAPFSYYKYNASYYFLTTRGDVRIGDGDTGGPVYIRLHNALAVIGISTETSGAVFDTSRIYSMAELIPLFIPWINQEATNAHVELPVIIP